MATATRFQRIYDHRLKDLVHETGDIQLAVRRGVPRSTARGWLCRSRRNVVTLDVLEATGKELRQEILALRRRNEKQLDSWVFPLHVTTRGDGLKRAVISTIVPRVRGLRRIS